MPREYHYTWTYDLHSTPEALWPLASDTNRFNRDTGLPPMQMLGIEHRVKRVRFRLPLVRIEWDEEPFEWTYPFRFGILRRYRTGPLTEMRVDCRLDRLEPGGTRLTYEVWATSRNLLGDAVIPLGIGIYSAQRFREAFLRYDRLAAAGGSLWTDPSRRHLGAAGRRRLEEAGEALPARGVDADVLARLREFLDQADDLSIQRMRPYALADRWNLPRRAVLEAFLHATRAGLLDLYWDILCPECRGVAQDQPRLSQVRAAAHCATCQIDFSARFDHNVEVIFRPNPSVRAVDETLEFCVGSPQRQPHVRFSLIVPAGESLPLRTMLEPGRYMIRASGLAGAHTLLATADGIAAVDIRARPGGWPDEITRIAPSPQIRLINATDQHRSFELLRTAWSDQAATALDVTTLQTFRDLFSSEVLKPGEEISVGSVALMFTDLRNSTRLYREIGDAPAFGRVREHFEILQRSVAAEGGAIVKTMGDAIMATFRSPAEAVRAVWNVQRELTARGDPRLSIKIGIHHGPCIVVNQNERLDYFGSTVNIAARLPAFSAGGELILSEPVRTDAETSRFLEEHARPNSIARFEGEIRGYGATIPLWRLKI